MLQDVDIVLLQELGSWNHPLSDGAWGFFLESILAKTADEWDARKNGPYAVLARRKDPRGGCGSDATKLFPWLEAPWDCKLLDWKGKGRGRGAGGLQGKAAGRLEQGGGTGDGGQGKGKGGGGGRGRRGAFYY